MPGVAATTRVSPPQAEPLANCTWTICWGGKLHGELDACSVSCLKARPMPIAMTGRDIIVDLAGLDFVDTAGVVALTDLQREARRAGGWLGLTKPPRQLRRLLQLVGMKDKFTTVDQVPSG
jgi:anti-anti-sigma factor